MVNRIVVGGQFGDEGKGKVIDYFAEEAAATVRFFGGDNAGHTVCANGRKYVLHLVPSGIVHEGGLAIIGAGVVANPIALAKELEYLKKMGVDAAGRIRIDERASVLMPYHRILDMAQERGRGSSLIGTTGRGIGPAYADLAARQSLRWGTLSIWDEEGNIVAARATRFDSAVAALVRSHVKLLKDYYGFRAEDFSAALRALTEKEHAESKALVEQGLISPAMLDYARFDGGLAGLDENSISDALYDIAFGLRGCIQDTSRLIARLISAGKSVLFEGAQGTLLDVIWGTAPYTTSSNAIAGGALTGSGVSPNCIDEVWGVFKAYVSKVGKGPFPTKIEGGVAERIRNRGNEYGASTGRPRDIGWFDVVAARYARQLNGFDSIFLTKLDVLSGEPEIQVCLGYLLNGRQIDYFPSDPDELAECKPLLAAQKGWSGDISDVRSFDRLPDAAKRYVKTLEGLIGVPIAYIGVGQGREQVIEVRP